MADGTSRQHAATETDYAETVATALGARQVSIRTALDQLATRPELLAGVAARLVGALRGGHAVLVAGNGGSSAEAQHFAAELVGRFKRDRAPYAALALSADSAILTAVANDYGFEEVFARQVLALGRPGDLLVAFSTSGESRNVLAAAVAARQRQMGVIAFTGAQDSSLARLADLTVRAPAADTATAQEVHTILTHVLCQIVEAELASDEVRP